MPTKDTRKRIALPAIQIVPKVARNKQNAKKWQKGNEMNPYERKINEWPELNGYNDKDSGRILGWVSGGVASAKACDLALKKYGDRVDLVFQDTHRENPDTLRFLNDLSKHWGREIKHIASEKFHDPEEIWLKTGGMNFAHGAPCSMYLKQNLRVSYQDLDNDFCHIFGFDFGNKKEMNRATNMLNNHPELNPVFPLIAEEIRREDCFKWLMEIGIDAPDTYEHFQNNNCMGANDSAVGGCVQGGVGYWQQIREVFPHKFHYMACWEHILSARKGQPVTICKRTDSEGESERLFLEPNPQFQEVRTLDVVAGKKPVVIKECNGFCSVDNQLEFNF